MGTLDGIWLALLFPALGFLYNALFGWALPKRWAGYAACAGVGLSFLVALRVFFILHPLPEGDRFYRSTLYLWIASGDLAVPLAVLVDPLSVFMALVVSGVGFLILVYSTGYMHDDPGYTRFFAYMSLFILAMLTLVLTDNFALLMVGWAGVGLCSYLLIAFWFQREDAARAGVKAFVVTVIGDAALMVAVLLIFTQFGTLDYDGVFRAAGQRLAAGGAVVTIITLLITIAAASKSAQIPFHVWLPDAMAGPTPVSALIHAATMVAAGVYLVARTHPLYELAPFSMGVIATVGALSALFAATIGLAQPNIKRVLAYSTISQLGYMYLGVGVGSFAMGMFHLMTHAFFKALLFLAGGGAIHALAGEEDLHKMGGLRRHEPLTYYTFLVGALALAGIPGLAGFFSKDEILRAAFAGNAILGLLALITVPLTAFYISRALFLAFHGPLPAEVEHIHTPPPSMTVPMVALAVLSALGGYTLFLGLENYLAPVFTRYAAGHAVGEAGLSYWILAGLSTLLALTGLGFAYAMYVSDRTRPQRLAARIRCPYRWLRNKYFVDELYGAAIVGPFQQAAGFLSDAMDMAFIDGIVNGLVELIGRASGALRLVQTGYVRNYALAILAGAVVIIAYFLRGF